MAGGRTVPRGRAVPNWKSRSTTTMQGLRPADIPRPKNKQMGSGSTPETTIKAYNNLAQKRTRRVQGTINSIYKKKRR